jgi:hypothetical protein
MRRAILASALILSCGAASAAPLSSADCARLVTQVEAGNPAAKVDLAALIRDGDTEVAGAARRLNDLQSAVPQPAAAITNATQDLRYQLQVCARR